MPEPRFACPFVAGLWNKLVGGRTLNLYHPGTNDVLRIMEEGDRLVYREPDGFVGWVMEDQNGVRVSVKYADTNMLTPVGARDS